MVAFESPSLEAAVKTLRLAVPLVLAAFTLTCQDQPADPLGPAGLAPVFSSCGDLPCGKGRASFALSFDGNDGADRQAEFSSNLVRRWERGDLCRW